MRSFLRLTLVLAFTACAVDDVDAPDDMELAAGAELDRQAPTADRKMITWNSLPYDAVTWNTLTTAPAASYALTDMPLSTATFGAQATGDKAVLLREHAFPEQARMFMKYLVGCALPPATSVDWQAVPHDDNAEDDDHETYFGALGLCPQWATGTADQACQERVSACILARNNGLGRTVRISLRGSGASDQALPLSNASYAFAEAPATNQPQLCQPGQPGCSYSTAPVGRCHPGESVSVTAIPAAFPWPRPRSTSKAAPAGSLRLRACSADKVCTTTDALEQCSGCTELEPFVCPDSGVYNVMVGAISGAPVTHRLVSTAGPLPEDELDVYRWREGAFYGNIFDPTKLGVNTYVKIGASSPTVLYGVDGTWYDAPSSIPGNVSFVAYRNMFSCSSDNWGESEAYATYRACASVYSEQCAAVYAGRCSNHDGVAGRCAVDDGGSVQGDGDFAKCGDLDDNKWLHPLTTFVKGACDTLLGNPYMICTW